jgi:hypothetical protein
MRVGASIAEPFDAGIEIQGKAKDERFRIECMIIKTIYEREDDSSDSIA